MFKSYPGQLIFLQPWDCVWVAVLCLSYRVFITCLHPSIHPSIRSSMLSQRLAHACIAPRILHYCASCTCLWGHFVVLCCFQIFLGTRLALYPGLSYEKEEGLIYATCISTVLLCRLAILLRTLTFYLSSSLLSHRDDSAWYVKQVTAISQKPGTVLMHVQTVYTRFSPFSWEGPGYEASTTPCYELCYGGHTYVLACITS